jgi:protein-L-isoaspartate(D-aspartate) O-methyltransferase
MKMARSVSTLSVDSDSSSAPEDFLSDSHDRSVAGNGFHPAATPTTPEDAAVRRQEMVERQLRKRGIHDERVLAVMLSVPRHEFVLPELAAEAYSDRPLPIGHQQTISQPFMVAAMAQALELSGSERVLEIGSGSGYQAAVLSLLAREVHTIETLEPLAADTRERLRRLGYANVQVHVGDGTLGWPDRAPFDAIVVTAAAPDIPPPLAAQLAEGGRLVIPVGTPSDQELLRVEKHGDTLSKRGLYHCRFVPLVGQYGWKPKSS